MKEKSQRYLNNEILLEKSEYNISKVIRSYDYDHKNDSVQQFKSLLISCQFLLRLANHQMKGIG
jgi:hypothetical protein